jgi:uncharacterized protein with GYD domain
MATFILLATWTDQGIRTVQDTAKRAEAFKKLATDAGVDVKDIYWTFGQYDIVALTEAPDDAAAMVVALTMGKSGNVRTQTLRAFSEADMGPILSNVLAEGDYFGRGIG